MPWQAGADQDDRKPLPCAALTFPQRLDSACLVFAAVTHNHHFCLDGNPALAVALVKISTLVFESSKVTTASFFSRLTSVFLTPSIFCKDLVTEVTQALHMMPGTDSVTVLSSAKADAAESAAAAVTARRIERMSFILSPIKSPFELRCRNACLAISTQPTPG